MRARVLTALLMLATSVGCVAPPIQQFTLATTDARAVRPRIVGPSVEGRHCFTQSLVRVLLRPPWRARRADHGRAVAAALAQVPEANVLTDVRMSVEIQWYPLFQRTCAIVSGQPRVLE